MRDARGEVGENPAGAARAARSARLGFLDALRGIAALAVVMQHLGTRLSADFMLFVQRYFDFGLFGVVLFFLCSGFIIPAALEKGAGLLDFWISRFFRLYPLYWASIIRALILAVFGRLPLPVSFSESPLATVLANFTMFQSFIDQPSLLVAYWTLGFELLFYLVMSALLLLRLHRQTFLLTLPLLLLPIVDRTMAFMAHTASDDQYLKMMTTLGTMCVGTVAYRYIRGQLAAPIAAVVFAVAPLATYCAFGEHEERGGLLGWQAAYLLFIVALLFRQRPVPRVCIYLGTISYSVYLANPLVVAAIPPLPAWPASIMLWLVAIFALSAVTYHWIERPCMSIGAQVRARRAARSAATQRLPQQPVSGWARYIGRDTPGPSR